MLSHASETKPSKIAFNVSSTDLFRKSPPPPQVVDFSSNLPPAVSGIFNSSQLLQFDCGGYFSRKLSTSADVLAQWVSHLFALVMLYLCLTRELLSTGEVI